MIATMPAVTSWPRDGAQGRAAGGSRFSAGLRLSAATASASRPAPWSSAGTWSTSGSAAAANGGAAAGTPSAAVRSSRQAWCVVAGRPGEPHEVGGAPAHDRQAPADLARELGRVGRGHLAAREQRAAFEERADPRRRRVGAPTPPGGEAARAAGGQGARGRRRSTRRAAAWRRPRAPAVAPPCAPPPPPQHAPWLVRLAREREPVEAGLLRRERHVPLEIEADHSRQVAARRPWQLDAFTTASRRSSPRRRRPAPSPRARSSAARVRGGVLRLLHDERAPAGRGPRSATTVSRPSRRKTPIRGGLMARLPGATDRIVASSGASSGRAGRSRPHGCAPKPATRPSASMRKTLLPTASPRPAKRPGTLG